jgi:hypothetical protein
LLKRLHFMHVFPAISWRLIRIRLVAETRRREFCAAKEAVPSLTELRKSGSDYPRTASRRFTTSVDRCVVFDSTALFLMQLPQLQLVQNVAGRGRTKKPSRLSTKRSLTTSLAVMEGSLRKRLSRRRRREVVVREVRHCRREEREREKPGEKVVDDGEG